MLTLTHNLLIYCFCNELSITLCHTRTVNTERTPQLSLSASSTVVLNLILFLITAVTKAWCKYFCTQLFLASSSAHYPHCWSFHSVHVLTYSFHRHIGTQSTSKSTAAQDGPAVCLSLGRVSRFFETVSIAPL